MKFRFWPAATPLIVILFSSLALAKPHPAVHYRIVGQISGPDGLWDYASVDAIARKLYIGKKGGLLRIDLAGPAAPEMLFPSPVLHMALPIGDGRLVAPAGPSNKALVVNGVEGRSIGEIPTGQDADTAAFDAKTQLAITFNRGGPDATIFDTRTLHVVKTLTLPEKAEFAVGDGNGTVYVNLTQSAQIGVIDIAAGQIARTFKLPQCVEPTGLALDRISGLLISACSNGIADVVSVTGRRLASLKIGPGADAVFIDARRRLAFVPSGGDGTLSIISLADPTRVRVIQVVKTQVEARTGAVDPVTGTVYLPVGTLLPLAPGQQWPGVVPGSFKILMLKP